MTQNSDESLTKLELENFFKKELDVQRQIKEKQEAELDNKKQQHFCYILIQLLEKDLEIDFMETINKNKEELIEILEEHLNSVIS